MPATSSGISEVTTARPIQAALDLGGDIFGRRRHAAGYGRCVMPPAWLVAVVSVASLLFLAVLGAVGAKAGGANVLTATVRVTFWGALAMALTAGIGAVVGRAV